VVIIFAIGFLPGIRIDNGAWAGLGLDLFSANISRSAADDRTRAQIGMRWLAGGIWVIAALADYSALSRSDSGQASGWLRRRAEIARDVY